MRGPAGCLALVVGLSPGAAWAQLPGGDGPDDPVQPVEKAPYRPEARAHLLLVVETSPAGIAARVATRVELPLPPVRSGTWRGEVVDGAGAVLHRQPLADPSVIRGEFHGPDGIEAVRIQAPKAAFALRLPLVEGAALVRLLAPAGELAPGDVRAGAAEPEAWVEVGSFAWPEEG